MATEERTDAVDAEDVIDEFNKQNGVVGDDDDDVLGAIAGPALLIQVKNIPELVAKQGGNVGKLINMGFPKTLATKVYTEMKSKMLDKFKEEGVNADITVLETAPGGEPMSGKQEILAGAALGASVVGLIWIFVSLGRK